MCVAWLDPNEMDGFVRCQQKQMRAFQANVLHPSISYLNKVQAHIIYHFGIDALSHALVLYALLSYCSHSSSNEPVKLLNINELRPHELILLRLRVQFFFLGILSGPNTFGVMMAKSTKAQSMKWIHATCKL